MFLCATTKDAKTSYFTTYKIIPTWFFIKDALAADSVTLPSNYSVNATDWVTIADSGTTPAISGFTNAFVIVSTTAGNIKITTTTGLSAINGFCGYDETNEKTASNY